MSVANLAPVLPAPVLTDLASPSSALNWPSPNHMRVVDPRPGGERERGLVTLNSGEKLQGTVIRIDFAEARLQFLPDAGPSPRLQFSDFHSLILERAIELERIPLAAPPGSVEAQPSGVIRKCAIVFKDGATLDADVVSVLRRKSGLFLFVKHDADACLRWFVPAEAIASHRIGEPLGKALRDRMALGGEALDAGLATQQRLHATRLGDHLANQGIVTREALEAALLQQNKMSHLRIGDALVQQQLITAEQRDAALAEQAIDRHVLLGEILVRTEAVTREDIRRVLVEQLGVPSVNLQRFPCDPNAVKAVPGHLARKHQAMPLSRSRSRIVVAIENPLSWESLQELEFFTGLKVDPAIAAREDLTAAIAQFYGVVDPGEHIGEIVAELGAETGVALPADVEVVTESDNTLVRLVNKIIVDAYDQGASDIHIECRADEKPSRVRFRVDGVLVHYIDVPYNFRSALISRLKIMSLLDISERRRPQDGKIRFEEFGPRRLELRVVTMPTRNGLEDVVMRILAPPRALTLDLLDLAPPILTQLKAIAARSFGLVLVCGPTGSGKTTTLHTLLNHLNTPERKIWTVEDPIEITQDGLCQVQVNAKLGLSFAAVLRSFLRADPDVIMVGEMRDVETANTVVAASLTGHLVLSTIHTNSAVESVVRLLDFGLDPFNFADALLGVIGQRLVRRLCPACRTPHAATRAEVEALAHQYCGGLGLAPAEIAAHWRSRFATSDGDLMINAPVGCPQCDSSGYKGRIGVYELLVASPAIKAKIQAKASSAEILQEAIAGGMITLQQDAIEKILHGHLDLKQVQAVCV